MTTRPLIAACTALICAGCVLPTTFGSGGGPGGGSSGGGGGGGGTGGAAGAPGGSADWKAQDSGAGNWLTGIHCPSATTCVAVGTVLGQGKAFILRTTDGGDSWVPVMAPAGAKGLAAVHFPDAMTGYAVGGDTFDQDGITILKTIDGGATWSALSTTAKGSLNGIHCTSATSCVAVGGSLSAMTALILKTTDGGGTWSSFVPPATTTNFLSGVQCVAPSTCYAAGTYFNISVVLRSSDGGGSWTKVFHNTNTAGSMKGVHFLDPNLGYAVGAGRLEKTLNGGALWKNQPASALSLNAMSCLDANNCLLVGAVGGIFKTTNGGTTWMKQQAGTANSLAAVHWVDATTAYVVGDNIADGTNGTILKMKVPNGSTGADVAAGCCDGDGGVGTVTISGASASNVNEAPMSTARVSGFYANGGGAVIWVQDAPAPGHVRLWAVNLNDRPATGRVFALPQKNLANNTWSDVSYTTKEGAWQAASGSCTVNSVNGKAVSITVQASMTPPTTGAPGSQDSVGGFSVNLNATLKEMSGL